MVVGQSQAGYFVGPDRHTTVSNTVTSTVLPVFALQLAPPGTVASPAFTVQGNEGDTLYGTFTLANTGNDADSAVVTTSIHPSSTVPVDGVVVFRDANGNGRYDPGEEDPFFLSLPAGAIVDVDVGIVLASGVGTGNTFVEIAATSTGDPGLAVQTSVAEASNLGPPGGLLHFGPFQNAQALPGGEGSADDVTTRNVGFTENFVEFRNDITNLDGVADLVEVFADTTGWPSGLSISVRDSLGGPLPISGNSISVGALGAGQTRTLITTVSSPGPLESIFADTLSLPLAARSLNDTLRVNLTTDHIVAPAGFQAAGALGLAQTFRENVAAFGDVVTLVVTVTNNSTIGPLDNVVVTEAVQSNLNFLSSPAFVASGDNLVWNAGTLMPGEKREAAIKFILNSRTSHGRTKVIGHAVADAAGNQVTATGPEINVLRIRNDMFGDEGVVMGSVYVDANSNDRRDDGERGMAGVAVYLESGEYALTDSVGKFSIERAYSGYRIVRLDESTVPAGFEWVPGPNDREDATSERVVHLLPGGHASVTFGVREIPVQPKMTTRSILSRHIVNVNPRTRVVYQIPAVPSSFFPPGKVFLKTERLPILEPIVRYLAQNPGMVVLIEGHTDSIPIHTPDFPSNYELGLARANALRNYLTANGVPEAQIVTRSYGESKPVATNATVEGRARNRRVEVGFISAGMKDSDVETAKREQTELQQLSERPDSVDVRVLWDISTNSPRSFDVDVELMLPSALDGMKVHLNSGDLEFGGNGNRFVVSGFRRSAGLRVEVAGGVAAADTGMIRDIRARFDFSVTQKEYARDDTLYSVVLQPFATSEAVGHDLTTIATWVEKEGEETPADTTVTAGRVDVNPLGNEVGIIAPTDGAVVSLADQVTVSICAPLGARNALRVNGEAVDQNRVGQKIVRLRDRLEDITYYGLKLKPGWNRIALASFAVDGTVHRDSIAVALAGRPTVLEAMQKRVLVPADGFTSRQIRFAVKDHMGFDVVDGVVATVTEGDTLLIGADSRPAMPGFQITSRGGYYEVLLRSSRNTMRRTITVELNGLQARCDVAWVPPRRTAFLTGLAEARLGMFAKSGNGNPDGLENFDDGAAFGGDARFFLQGTGYGGINLTARVDTRPRANDSVFKSINPDRQYTTYGDASELRYAAPAWRGNYIALEKDESFARYGDFESPLTDGEFLQYRRTATGVSGALISGDYGVKGFATKTDFATIQDELPGDGTSGFYYLSRRPVVENSLKLEIQIRDRFRLEKVLEVRPMVLNRDYTINYFNGAVLFKEPVPVTTFDLNPIMIVARYEVQTDAEKSYLYGLRGDVVRKGAFRLGTTAVGRGSELDYALYGVDGGFEMGPLGLSGEFARSDDDVTGEGNAWKVGARLSNDVTETSVYLRKVDGNFNNPSFAGSAHELYAQKAGFDTSIKLSPRFSIEGDGYYHDYDKTDEKKTNVAGVGVYRTERFSLSGGVRAAGHDTVDESRDATLVLAGAGATKPGVFEFGTHWEHNLGDETVEDFPDRLKSSLGVPIVKRLKMVLTHEYLSAHDRDATHQLLAGVEGQAGRYTTAFSKYSLNRTGSDERMGAVSGVKQMVPLQKNLTGTLDVEGFRSFSNARDDEYVAFKGGLNWRRLGVAFAEGQYEYRWQRRADRHLIRLNAARQWEGGLALLLREALSVTTPDQGDDALSFDGRIAASYRPDVSPVWTLFMVKSLYDRRAPVDPEAIKWRFVFSTDVNIAPAARHELRTKLAMKYVEDYSEGFSETTRNYLVLSQYVYRIDRLWDFDIWGRYMGQDGVGADQFGAGVEVGRILFSRLRVGAGYSINGFQEHDMAERDAWEKGFGVRVQLLLMDWVLNEFGMER